MQKAEILEKTFNIVMPESVNYSPSFNISPGNSGLVITADRPREAQSFMFGLTPHWAKKPMYLFNARAEGDHNKENNPAYKGARGIINKPSFRKAIRSQRCLVIADAFIEGTTAEKLNKPYLIYLRDRKPFAFAGIWDSWCDTQTGEVINSYAIITTVSNELLQKLPHHRSPVILEKSQEQQWLHGKHLNDITWMLKPYMSGLMNGYPISNAIRKPDADGIHLIKPTGDRLMPEERITSQSFLELHGMGRYKVR